ncbi:MBL fold metallo-hydrolase [Novosphingobium rosa]|uniref:MBL fold metallo-hydrolase n=1 Tax=Novosphingobium rosa TaxID=76978 RepID=UPI000834F3E2|nr:MBL fold metallo-hydrolase [Novosphingobium rosa]
MRLALALALLLASPAAAQTPPQWVTLGTHSGPIPDDGRAQPANLLLAGGHPVLVDVGDGAVDQLAKAGVRMEAIDTLFISHAHFDHIGGLFALLGRRYQVISPNVLTIYGPVGTAAVVKGLVSAMDAAAVSGSVIRTRAGHAPAEMVKVVEIGDGSQLAMQGYRVTVATNSHYDAGGDKAMAAASLSYRFDTPGRSIVYTGDTGPSAKVEALARGADLLVSEIIDPDAALAHIRKTRPDVPEAALKLVEAHYRAEHLSPAEVGKLAAHAGVKALVLTHDAVPPANVPAARAAIAATYPGPATFAADLDRF